jgi:hypothetical protein
VRVLPRPLTPAERALLVRLAGPDGQGGSVSEWELDHVALGGLLDLGLVGRVDAYRAHLVTVTAEGVDAACEIAGEEEQP